MIESTLTGLARGFSPGFAAAAVREGIMSPLEAREYLALQDDVLQEAVGVAALLGQSPEDLVPIARSTGDRLRAILGNASFGDEMRLSSMTPEVEHELNEVSPEDLEQLGWPPRYASDFSLDSLETVRKAWKIILGDWPLLVRSDLAVYKALGAKRLEIQKRAQLVPHLPEHRRQAEIREIWPSIPSLGPKARGNVLRFLAPHLPDDLMSEALAIARRIERPRSRSFTLGALLPRASREAIQEQITAITAIHDDDDRAEAMELLALGLGRVDCLLEAVQIVGMIQDASLQDRIVLALGGLGLRKDVRPDAALSSTKYGAPKAQEKTDWVFRTAYMEIVRRVAQSEGPLLDVMNVLETLRKIHDRKVRKALTGSASPDRGTAIYQNLIMKVRMARKEPERIQLCSAYVLRTHRVYGSTAELAPLLPDEILESMLGCSCRLSRCGMTTEVVESLVGAAARLEDRWLQTEVLARLMSRLIELGRGDKAAEIQEAVDLQDKRDVLLRRTYDLLVTNGQFGAASVVAESMNGSPDRDHTLRSIALRAADLGHGQGALRAASSISAWNDRDRTLRKLIPKLRQSQMYDAAILAVRRMADAALRREALVALAPGLPLHLQPQVLKLAREMSDAKMRDITLVRLISHFGKCWTWKKSKELPPPLRQEVVAKAIGLWEEGVIDEFKVIPAIALINLGHFGDALEKAKRILDNWQKERWPRRGRPAEEFFERLLPHVPEERFDDVLEVIRSIEDRRTRIRVMTHFARCLASRGYPREALALAKEFRRVTIGGSSPRGEIYLAIACHLPETLKLEVLKDLAGWWDDLASALRSMAPYLTTLSLANEALEAASRITDDLERVETLAALAVHFPRGQRQQAIEEAFDLAQKIYRVNKRTQAFKAIAPQLSLPQWSKVVTDALEVEDASDAVEMLRTLCPSLAQFSGSDLHPLWQAAFIFLRSRSRAELVLGLGALSPVTVAIGGPKAVVDTARAVQDVARWWP
jgi:hypothetical protein